MTVLTLDSSSQTAAVGIYRDGAALYESFLHTGLTHSETLGLMLEDAFRVTRLRAADLDQIAVTNGPGSFTGLRIGVAAALGLGTGANVPVVGVSTLEALAQSAAHMNGLICPVLDARRSQVYTALFRAEHDTLTRLTEDAAEAIEIVKEKNAGESIFYLGDGANLCYNKEKDRLSPPLQYVRAYGVWRCAAEGHVCPADKLRYLRLPQAERERKERLAREADQARQ